MGSVISSPPDSMEYTPTPSDVAFTRQTLLHKLPRELVDKVIDFARYWPRISLSSAVEVKVSAKSGGSKYSEKKVLCVDVVSPIRFYETPTAEGEIAMETWVDTPKVKAVKFVVESHDQGWGGSRNHRGSYVACWSWWEVAILRRQNNPAQYKASLSQPESKNESEDESEDESDDESEDESDDESDDEDEDDGDGWREVDVNGSTRFHLQNNIHVSNEFARHTLVWTDEELSPDASDDRSGGQGTGRGVGRGFVNALRLGDRISVLAIAQFPGWANHVRLVEVEVYYHV